MTTPAHVETPSEDWGPFGIPGPDDLLAEPAEAQPHVTPPSEAPFRDELATLPSEDTASEAQSPDPAEQPHITPTSEAPYSPLLVK